MSTAETHPAWCSPAHCYRTEFYGLLALDTTRQLRDQLTTHLDAVQ